MTPENFFYSLGVMFVAGLGVGVLTYAHFMERQPKPVPHVETARLQLSCNREGIQEWYRTCRARERMEQIHE